MLPTPKSLQGRETPCLNTLWPSSISYKQKNSLISKYSTHPPLKANLFLSFQTVQKIHNGMDFQIFFLFFPTNGPLQEVKASFTVSGRTHLTSTNPKIISHRALVTIQYKRIWFTFSSSQPHKKQQLGSSTPLIWSLSRVSTFPHVASQAKKATLVGTLSTHMLLEGKAVALRLSSSL